MTEMTAHVFKHLSSSIFCYIVITFTITWSIHWIIRSNWERFVNSPGFKPIFYKGETFRSPLNTGMIILSIMIPFTSVLFTYEVARSSIVKLDLLVIAVLCFLSAMIWSVYQSYSIATQCTNDDKFEINRNNNWLIPADFSAQLVVLILGIVWLTLFLIFSFKPIDDSHYDSFLILHAKPKIGMSAQDLVEIWNNPIEIKKHDSNIIKY